MMRYLLLSVLVVCVIGVMVPSVYAVLSFVDESKDPSHYVIRYLSEPDYKEWFDKNYPDNTIWEAIDISDEEFNKIALDFFSLSVEPARYSSSDHELDSWCKIAYVYQKHR